jgi:hypothetical protein
MGRLYQQLLLTSGAALIVIVATTPSSAQDTRTKIGDRIISAQQHSHRGNRPAAPRSSAVRPVQYTVTGDPETISSGIVTEGTFVENNGSVGQSYAEDSACCDSGCGSQGCGSRGCGRRRNRQTEGAGDPWYNCSCNGSYKFPVPPLYTYHWPGMYSQELMTNYHSPWRFPPLRPYEDEPAPDEDEPQAGLSPGYLPVSHQSDSSRYRGYEPLSAKIERLYGTVR